MADTHTDHISTLANNIKEALVQGEKFDVDINIPEIEFPDDLTEALESDNGGLTEEALTERVPKGTGMFDAIMESMSEHLKEEYDAGRITQADYTQAYITASQAALQAAVQYLTSKDRAYWEGVTARVTALKAKVDYELGKLNLALSKINVESAKADYAAKIASLASLEADYDGKLLQNTAQEYTNTNMLPKQLEQLQSQIDSIKAQTAQVTYTTNSMLPKQVDQVVAQTAQVTYSTSNILPKQVSQLQAQIDNTTAQTAQVTYTTANTLPKQVEQLTAQIAQTKYGTEHMLPEQVNQLVAQTDLVKEQRESERGKTLDTRTDGTTAVTGLIGKQKGLYQGQTDGYKRNSETQAAKLWMDSVSTIMSATDEGIDLSGAVDINNVRQILGHLMENNNFGTRQKSSAES